MDFILNEAEVEDKQYKLVFSDDKAEELAETIEDQMFIVDSSQSQQERRRFYRDLNNTDDYVRFQNQTRDPIEVANEPEEEYYGEDDLPFFATDHEKAKRFKDSLICFPDVENHFFML